MKRSHLTTIFQPKVCDEIMEQFSKIILEASSGTYGVGAGQDQRMKQYR